MKSFWTNTGKNWWKCWFEGPETFLLCAVALMTILGVSLTSAGPARDAFWLFCVPPTLWILVKHHGYRALWENTPLRWAFGLLVLYMASTFWSAPTTRHEQMKELSSSLQTMLFVMGLFFALRAPSYQKQLFAKLLIVACIVGTSICVFSFYSRNPLSARLFAHTHLLDWPSTACPLVLGCLMTAGLILEEQKAPYRIPWLLAGALFVGVFLFVSQTRTTLISFSVLVFMWGIYYLGVKKSAAVVATMLLIGTAFVLSHHSLDKVWSEHIDTGLLGRDVIWLQDIKGFIDKPFFGHGAATIFVDTIYGKTIADTLGWIIRHPHGLFFSMLFYFGLAGVILWFGLLLMIAKNLWNRRDLFGRFSLSALLCLLLMTSTDTHNLSDNVDVCWWIWWLPSIVLIVSGREKRTKQPTNS